ncbi:Na+/H+ antiporter NhaA [Corynebacterium kutscheri]|uniref:Na+/H+ antiporter NhaA n=1 Tax=Corynebacterium kutscheri TaxID=35755 RepID=UPI002F93051C
MKQAPAASVAAVARDALSHALPINQRLSYLLPPYVNYFVVSLFALANAGVTISAETLSSTFSSKLFWGVIAGLVIGKLVGVLLGAVLVLQFLPASRLPGLDMPRIAGVAALSGMGFTISLLVANLALDDQTLNAQASAGVLLASLLAFALASLIFKIGDKVSPLSVPDGEVLPRGFNAEVDHYVGKKEAPIHFVVYNNFSYPGRYRLADALHRAIEIAGKDDRVSYTCRYMVSDEIGQYIAGCLEYADTEGKYWEFHNRIVEVSGELDVDALEDIAKETGIDVKKMKAEVGSGKFDARIHYDQIDVPKDYESMEPIMFLQGKRVHHLINDWSIAQRVRDEIEKLDSLVTEAK